VTNTGGYNDSVDPRNITLNDPFKTDSELALDVLDDEVAPTEFEGDIKVWEALLRKMRTDLKAAADELTLVEARYLVDSYYQVQSYRIRAGGQTNAMERSDEPHIATVFLRDGIRWIEDSIKGVLDAYTKREPSGMGVWAREVVGIGPVLSAGLLAHRAFDPRFETVGHTWAFFGLDPTKVWEKGERRPWNARAKVLCYKIGESFVKVQNRPNDIYGHVYAARKLFEIRNNYNGKLMEQAQQALELKNYRKETDAYKWYSGQWAPPTTWPGEPVFVGEGRGLPMLPPAHIHARARRYAVKAFISDYWMTAYERFHKKAPPLPYPIVKLGHAELYRDGQWRDRAESMKRTYNQPNRPMR
jgi:hypothetical protein